MKCQAAVLPMLLGGSVIPILAGSCMEIKSKAKMAIDAMLSFYNQTDGRWSTQAPWWLSGNAMQATLDFMAKTGSLEYMPQAVNTFTKQSATLPWWPSGGGDFRADSTDDTGWWALASVRMFDLTGDQQYLTYAKEDEAYMYSFWSNHTCQGGIIWDIPSRSYKNAISNELYLKLVASLHNRIPGDTLYLSRAKQSWAWFKNSGMINSDNLINDGLSEESNGTCTNNGGQTWTYNQGVILGGLAELYKATKDRSLLETARQIANAVMTSALLSPNGILTEPCEAEDNCGSDAPAFKGIFVRNLDELQDVLPGSPYIKYLDAQITSAYNLDRNSSVGNLYGLKWAGPFDEIDIARQSSAVSLLVANLKGTSVLIT